MYYPAGVPCSWPVWKTGLTLPGFVCNNCGMTVCVYYWINLTSSEDFGVAALKNIIICCCCICLRWSKDNRKRKCTWISKENYTWHMCCYGWYSTFNINKLWINQWSSADRVQHVFRVPSFAGRHWHIFFRNIHRLQLNTFLACFNLTKPWLFHDFNRVLIVISSWLHLQSQGSHYSQVFRRANRQACYFSPLIIII